MGVGSIRSQALSDHLGTHHGSSPIATVCSNFAGLQLPTAKEAEIFFFSGLDDLPVDTKDIWERPEKILY